MANPGGAILATGNWLQFARGILFDLALPDTPDNEAALLTWFNREQPPGSPNGAFNPLNIQAGNYPHSGTSGSGQYNFNSWDDGIHQTAEFLRQGAYSGILTALSFGNNASAVLVAIQDSPWASGHYGGTLPDSLSYTLQNWETLANGLIAGADPSATNSSLLDPSSLPKGFQQGGSGPVQLNPLSSVLGASVKALTFLIDPHNWVRIGMVAGGIALIAVAYGIINHDTIGGAIKGAAEMAAIA